MAIDTNLLAAAFTPGRELPTPRGLRKVLNVETFLVEMPTGKIVACDPIYGLDQKPFSEAVPPGTYEVTLSILDQLRDGPRTAFARLLLPKAKIASLDRADPPEFGTDLALACFIDASQAAVLRELTEDQADEYFHKITNAEQDAGAHFAGVSLDPFCDGYVCVFSSGMGDGSFSSYYGRDKNGRVAGIVLDFGIVGTDAPENA